MTGEKSSQGQSTRVSQPPFPLGQKPWALLAFPLCQSFLKHCFFLLLAEVAFAPWQEQGVRPRERLVSPMGGKPKNVSEMPFMLLLILKIVI